MFDFNSNNPHSGDEIRNLSEADISFISKLLSGDKTAKELALIYETMVPKVQFDTDAIVRAWRSKFTNGA